VYHTCTRDLPRDAGQYQAATVLPASASGPQAVIDHPCVTSNQAGRYDMVQGPSLQGTIPAHATLVFCAMRANTKPPRCTTGQREWPPSCREPPELNQQPADLGEVVQGPSLQGTIPAHATPYFAPCALRTGRQGALLASASGPQAVVSHLIVTSSERSRSAVVQGPS